LDQKNQQGLRYLNISLPALALLSLLVTSGCVENQAGESTISVAYIENASNWPFFVASEKGLFEKSGLKVQAINAKDSTEALNALLARKVDVSIENTYSALFAIEGTSPGTVRLFFPCSETPQRFVSHFLVASDSSVRKPEELKGKRIGTYTGSTQLLTLKLFLRSYLNWDPDKDVQIIQVAPSLQLQALTAGQYDALFTIEPFASAALAKGVARDILPYARGKILDPFPAGASSIRAGSLQTKKDALRKLYAAMVRGAEFIERNPPEAKAILAKWTNLDQASSEHVGGYEYHTFAAFDGQKRERVQRLADLYLEGGILSKPIRVDGLFLSEAALD
jgi:ABC-type nitrate/sulfonate/bicarbonate transport system substrate-binding protein